MISEKVLYTDGHDVTITDSVLLVKKSLYQLKGITNHSFLIIHPDRLPAFFLALVGAMMICLGAFGLIPAESLGTVKIYTLEMNVNTLTLVVGVMILIIGAVIMSLMKDRYAVRIATAEGEKNVVISPRKEYISQIVDALNKAFLSVISPTHRKIKKENKSKA